MTTEFLLELFNGVWMVLSLSLASICAAYLKHEIIARQLAWPSLGIRANFTRGMRIALAIFALSIGIAMRSGVIFFWRFFGGDFQTLNQNWLLVGGIVSVLGFVCAIREMSKPLYGRGPWAWTVLIMVVFAAIDVIVHFSRN